jgi:hypothetical protein
MIGTYRDEFPPGTRVVIRAAKSDGTDYDFNGRKGAVVEFYKCLAVELDKPPKYGSNPVLISPHCFRHLADDQ